MGIILKVKEYLGIFKLLRKIAHNPNATARRAFSRNNKNTCPAFFSTSPGRPGLIFVGP